MTKIKKLERKFKINYQIYVIKYQYNIISHILQFSFCYETGILKKLQYVQYANINIFSTIFPINKHDKAKVLDKYLDNNWKKNNAAFTNIRYEQNCQLRSDENES